MSYRELLREIEEAQAASEPLAEGHLRTYLVGKHPKTRALLFSLFTNPSVWRLAKNLSSSERNSFLIGELRIALIQSDSLQSGSALTRGDALREITDWLLRLLAEIAQFRNPKAPSESREIAGALVRILEDAARPGDEELRGLIVTAVLEHVLSSEIAVDMFYNWRKDGLLKPLLEEGLRLSGCNDH